MDGHIAGFVSLQNIGLLRVDNGRKEEKTTLESDDRKDEGAAVSVAPCA